MLMIAIIDRPSRPKNVSVQYDAAIQLLNISWTMTFVMGVEQNYTIVFDTHMVNTTQLYCVHYLGALADNCGDFLAFVKAVNGAGESDPSNNVSIPSLPDIGPVTASLTHQVWKYDGEIRVNVSFEVRYILWYHDVL